VVGDAIINRGNKLSLGPAALSTDPAARPVTLARLPADASVIGFAHGAPLTGASTQTYRQLLQDL